MRDGASETLSEGRGLEQLNIAGFLKFRRGGGEDLKGEIRLAKFREIVGKEVCLKKRHCRECVLSNSFHIRMSLELISERFRPE